MERICSERSKFFPSRVDSILEGLCHTGKQTEVTEIVQLIYKGVKHGSVSIYHNTDNYILYFINQIVVEHS